MSIDAQIFRRILVPIDGTRRSAAVVPYALDMARRFDSQVMLLHVLAEQAAHSRGDERGAIRHPAGPPSSGLAVLHSCCEQLEHEGVPADTAVRTGSPPDEILNLALEWRADLIAMATHSRQGVERLLLGSVADRVVRESKLPVLLISA